MYFAQPCNTHVWKIYVAYHFVFAAVDNNDADTDVLAGCCLAAS